MTLLSGSRLGPYEILAPLGAGGMGEVYRARDTRLGREVAVKVLPEDFARDPGRLRRFEGEARAASALSDPHIVAVFDVGEENGLHFFASELVEGSDLRGQLDSGALPLKKALDLAGQIASGLAAAHEKGIVHRDLKPENILVNRSGLAKIADFGLAKLTEPSRAGAPGESGSQLPTTDGHETSAGMVVGTVAYMSPEQAQGRSVDFRSDQFAFGTILYEMLSGRRPFRGGSATETLASILRDEPEPLERAAPAVPAPFRWIVERCLAKEPGERFSSTSDLAKQLEDLRSHLSEAARAAEVPRGERRRLRRRLPFAAAVAGLAAICAGAAYLLATRQATNAPPSFRPLTFRQGIITGARFGPDGRTVYYSAAYGGEPSRIFVTRLDGTESAPLDLPPAILLSVSRQNELAVLLTSERNPHNSHGTLARVPALGGTPRPLAEDAIDADWAPDGEQMAVSRGMYRVEFPLGHPLLTPNGMAQDPQISPTGDHLAFADADGEEITDLGGRRLASHRTAWQFGKAWTPDGKELWFTGSESGGGYDRALYALSLTGRLRLILRTPVALTVWAVGADRRSALLSTGAAWMGINAARAGARKEQPLDLLGRTSLTALSADGRSILAWEHREVGGGAYLRSTDGSRTLHLGSEEPLGLSPDGAWVLMGGQADRLRLVPTGPGVPRPVPTTGLQVPPGEGIQGRAQWSREGRRLFLSLLNPLANTPNRSSRIYVRDGEGTWRPITPAGIAGRFAVSPDGRQLAVRDGSGALGIYPVDGGVPRPVAGETGIPILWSADGRWLYLQASTLALPARVYRRDLATGRIEPWRDVAPADLTGVAAISDVMLGDDALSYAYRYARQASELYLAEGLK